MAVLSNAEEEHEQAVRLCTLANSLRVKAHTPLPSNEQRTFEAMLAQARSVLTEERFAAAWRQGMMLTNAEAMRLALAQSED